MSDALVTAPPVAHSTAAILFDIVDYSKLTDEQQFQTITLLSQSFRAHLDVLSCQSFLTAEELLLGMIPTGDGLYLLMREQFADFGVLLALSLRTRVLSIRETSQRLFAGVRTCVHVGNVIPVSDIVGGSNFVGSGLNDCARYGSFKPSTQQLDEVGCGDGNWVIASSAALARFYAAFAFPAALRYRDQIGYTAGTPFTFADKHGRHHAGCLIEALRYLDRPPPPLPDLSQYLRPPFAGASSQSL